MFTLSAFADEISPDPQEQVDVLLGCGVRHVELRSILKTNVLDLTDLQVRELKALLDRHGLRLSAIGSPIGKVRIDQPFGPHLERFERALALCKVFDTPNVRVFSYYRPEGGAGWDAWRGEVLARLGEQVRRAERAGVVLLHENEHNIYGDDPARVVDLMQSLNSPHFRAVYDAANYVFCGYDPWDGWRRAKPWTAHFHVKDWVAGAKHGCLAGEGQGRWPDVLAEVAGTYDGFATLEPHLLGGGPTGGVTGPELFPRAVAAFTAILDRVGAKYG
jgi:sugar phosphate isomerase/epimerase